MILAWWQLTLIILGVILGSILAILAIIGTTIFLVKWVVYAFMSKEQRRLVRQKVRDHFIEHDRIKLSGGGEGG